MKNRLAHGLAIAAGLGLALFASTRVNADAGLLRVSEDAGPYRISVFSEPTPLRVDRATLSILVADRETGRPLRDVDVRVQVGPATDPAHASSQPAQRSRGGLRFSAPLDDPGEIRVCPMHPEFETALPGRCPHCGMDLVARSRPPGAWAIEIEVRSDRGEGSVSFKADIEARESTWISLGPALAVPPLGIGLFVLNQVFQKRMQSRRTRRAVKSRRTSNP